MKRHMSIASPVEEYLAASHLGLLNYKRMYHLTCVLVIWGTLAGSGESQHDRLGLLHDPGPCM